MALPWLQGGSAAFLGLARPPAGPAHPLTGQGRLLMGLARHRAPLSRPRLPLDFGKPLLRQPLPAWLLFPRLSAIVLLHQQPAVWLFFPRLRALLLLSQQPGVIPVADLVAGIRDLSAVRGNMGELVLVPHPRRHFLPLLPQVLLVIWPKTAWVTRTSDPCWVRLMSWRGNAAVVAPFVLGGRLFMPLVLAMLSALHGRVAPTTAVHTILRLRRCYTLQVGSSRRVRRRRRSVRLAGCDCTSLRGMVEKPLVASTLPRHLWSGCMVAHAQRPATTALAIADARRHPLGDGLEDVLLGGALHTGARQEPVRGHHVTRLQPVRRV